MNYLLARMRERSTYQGLITLLSAFGIYISPELTQAIIAAGIGAAGLVHALFPQSGVVAPDVQVKVGKPFGALLAAMLLAGSLSACAIPIATMATVLSSVAAGAAGTYAAVEQGKLAARTSNIDGVAAGLNAYCASYGGTAAAINREALKTSLVAAGVEEESARSVTASFADMRASICSAAKQAAP